jgi:hypothetical protein
MIQEIINGRLVSQHLIPAGIKRTEVLVSWLCAIQAQDYPASQWAIGIRLPGITDQVTKQAIADFQIVRSWIMRGTLHLAAASDIRWLLNLVAPRLIRTTAPRYRQLELSEDTFNKSNDLLVRALEGGKELTRDELSKIFQNAGIETTGQRMPHLLQRAALEQLICFGAKREKQFTFTLLDEAIPPANPKSRDEALAEIAKRYFISRGPATLHDFVWWSGLTARDARQGLESVKSLLTPISIDGQDYFFSENIWRRNIDPDTTFLLPPFDEFVIAYRDRSALLDAHLTKQVISANGIFYPVVIVSGKVAGVWKRTFQKNKVLIEINPFITLSKNIQAKITDSAKDFGKFTGKEVETIFMKL